MCNRTLSCACNVFHKPNGYILWFGVYSFVLFVHFFFLCRNLTSCVCSGYLVRHINAGLLGCIWQRSRPDRMDTQKLPHPPYEDFIPSPVSSDLHVHVGGFYLTWILGILPEELKFLARTICCGDRFQGLSHSGHDAVPLHHNPCLLKNGLQNSFFWNFVHGCNRFQLRRAVPPGGIWYKTVGGEASFNHRMFKLWCLHTKQCRWLRHHCFHGTGNTRRDSTSYKAVLVAILFHFAKSPQIALPGHTLL